ncbi:WD repeat-containing protein 27-like [Actinia tenebrosa]|uniref:WD repeat-containing protein 27-like n=1 Tax=Actinia tenebrosa TaxID=6105 RepID=A0A6P8IG43_ACTTE|nr:WD repeat-containing protein 27-like [Actinia tenebrosa]
MAVSHEGVVRAACNGCRQLASNEQFIACPLSKTTIGVWWIPNLSKNPLQLSGHKKLVTCVCFGNKRKRMLLCTVSEDFIYIWNITKGYANYSSGCHDKDETFRPLCVGKDLGNVQHISFNSSDILISACIGKEVWILNIETCKLDSVLEGHISPLTQAQFCPWNECIIISIAEDRTYKVWDIQESCLVYQSPIVSGFPFISLAFDSAQHCMALGSTDGKVRVYGLGQDSSFRCMHEIDISQNLQKTLDKQKVLGDTTTKGPAIISSNPSWQKEEYEQDIIDSDKTSGVDAEAGIAILGLQFMKIPGQTMQGTKSPLLPFLNAASQSQINDIFHVPSILVVGMTASVLLVNCNTWELLHVLDFRVPILSSNELDNIQYHLPTAGLYAFTEREQNVVQCVIGSLFNSAIHIINIRMPKLEKDANPVDVLANRLSESSGLGTQGVCDIIEERKPEAKAVIGLETSVITVLSSEPLHANSPLKAELLPKSSIPPSKKTLKKGPSTKGKTSLAQDQPLTFKSKVKSSGYTDAPRSKMFSPKTNSAKKSSAPSKKSSSGLFRCVIGKEYPMQSNPPTHLQEKMSLTSQPTGINCITYSGNGRHLACALSNKSARILRVPPSNNKDTVLTGHDGSLTHIQFSHDNKWLLTSSTDRTVRLWSPALSDPLLTFTTVSHNFNTESDTKAKNKDNPPFPKEITQASFYYVDKFIMVSCGNGLYLYKYHIDPQKDDIKRYQSHSKYKLVKLFQQERAQSITCFSCVNGFHSYITLCCGSNKSIEVFDMNVGRSVRVLMDAHSRPAHAICQNQGSAYASHSPEAYDLFLTAAVTDGIKMWDLRTNRCVRRYEGHVNRSHPTGIAISPCSRYIATGSEDRSVYLFDVRGSSFCHRLTGHTEVVADVAFHPAHSELAAASLDGKLKFYTEELR